MPTMKKENVTITFESEQLAALEFSLKKKNTSVQAQLEELLKCLYESEVPEPVREYLASRAAHGGRSSPHLRRLPCDGARAGVVLQDLAR